MCQDANDLVWEDFTRNYLVKLITVFTVRLLLRIFITISESMCFCIRNIDSSTEHWSCFHSVDFVSMNDCFDYQKG